MTRRRIILIAGIGVLAIGLGWVLMVNLERVLRVVERTPPPAEVQSPAQQASPVAEQAVPRITATLFFASEDGRGLVATQQEVPLAEGAIAQARALLEAQLTAKAPEPLISTIPEGTTVRGVFVSSRNEAFVDLGAAIRDKHPGGSMNELFTVYTIVNTLTTNIRDVESVQLLIDGREVDTLAGHVDLRRPLRKNELLITQ
jgi:spore germination protein GerM